MEDDQEQQGCTASWPDAEHQVRELMLFYVCLVSLAKNLRGRDCTNLILHLTTKLPVFKQWEVNFSVLTSFKWYILLCVDL